MIAATLAEYARDAAAVLEAAGHARDRAAIDVAVLARAVLGWDPARWIVGQREPVPAALASRLPSLLTRRAAHEPVAYLTGEREFYGRPFAVSPAVLIPRPETEGVIDAVIDVVGGQADPTRPPLEVLDIGTGSGCIAITLALERPDAVVVATDVSDAALTVAAENATRHGVESRVRLRAAAFAPGPANAFDVIAANPPYVAERDRASLAPDVRDHEPALALFGGADGLDVIRALVPDAARALRPEGWLVMEIGVGQSAAVEGLVRQADLEWHGARPDLAGVPRVVIARRARERAARVRR